MRSESKVPMKLTITIAKIEKIPNSKNLELVNKFFEYMRNNGCSEHHQNNNLIAVLVFGNCLGKDNSFLILKKIKSYDEKPDKRLITIGNIYLNRIKLFYI